MSFTGAPQKSDFLQPNISVGRPIIKPASKPESITGGQKIMAGTNRFGSHGHFSTGDKQSEEAGQSKSFGYTRIMPYRRFITFYSL